MTVTEAGAAALAALLEVHRDAAIEMGGLAALLESIAGQPLVADETLTARYDLSAGEQDILRPGRRDAACSRLGLLRTASGVPVAGISAVLLPRRVPGPARPALGITTSGVQAGGTRSGLPLEKALRGTGVRQLQLDAADPGLTGGHDADFALSWRALLLAAQPIAIVTAQVRSDFLAASPLPWSRLPGGTGPVGAPR